MTSNESCKSYILVVRTIDVKPRIQADTYAHANWVKPQKNELKLSQDSWKQFLLSNLSYHKHLPEVCFRLHLGKEKIKSKFIK